MNKILAMSLMAVFALGFSWRAPDNTLTPEEKRDGWKLAFNGADLTGWTPADAAGAWSVQDGTLYCNGKGGGMLYHNEKLKNFELKIDYKISQNGNSGVFIRVWDKNDPVNTGIEVQVLDSHSRQKPGRHDSGAIYDIMAPAVNAAKPAGEWNTFHIICKENMVTVHMNGQKIIDLNLNDYTEPGKNPDGSPNKFKYAYKEMVKAGHIALQNHGNEVWYRNVKVKPL